MRLLVVTPRVPFPPNKGDKVRTFHVLRHLAERHRLTVVTLVDQGDDVGDLGVLHSLTEQLLLVDNPLPAALARAGLALLRGDSASVGFFGNAAMRRAVEKALAQGRFDAMLVMSSALAQYLPRGAGLRRIIDVVDVDSEKWRQLAARGRAPMRWVHDVEARRVAALERSLPEVAEAVTFVSREERDFYRSRRASEVAGHVVANGVDSRCFSPFPAPAVDAPPRLLFTGALDYEPNVDALEWFVTEVLPSVREGVAAVRLTAVGHRPSRRVRRLADGHPDMLEVFGSVPAVQPHYEGATLFVAPLRMGRGVKVKVLEAMAMAMPTVGTSIAVEGLTARHGEHLLVADSAADFAASVLTLLGDPPRRARLGRAARRLVEDDYRWETNLAGLEAILAGSAPDPGESR